MYDSNHPELTFNLPPIKFSGKSSVKELAVTVHVSLDESNRLNEFLLKEVLKQSEKESTSNAKQE
jgi:hypothetical protein